MVRRSDFKDAGHPWCISLGFPLTLISKRLLSLFGAENPLFWQSKPCSCGGHRLWWGKLTVLFCEMGTIYPLIGQLNICICIY